MPFQIASILQISERNAMRSKAAKLTSGFDPVARVREAVAAATQRANSSKAARRNPQRRVLHVGCGSADGKRLHPLFKSQGWDEIRLDIDETTNPDIAGSIVDMTDFAADGSCDAIWASHVIEHLSQHEVAKTLREFRRVLSPTGFALMRTPDIESVAQFILDGRIRDTIYVSRAGPITPLDMMYGHGSSIERGSQAMRHGTAFTQDSLAADLIDAGFAETRVTRTPSLEVWAVAFMPDADIAGVLQQLYSTGIDFHDEDA
jgi:SAM-dependent methyltransferase